LIASPLQCWCGNQSLEPFSEDYLRCPVCESLLLSHWPDELFPKDSNEEAYYGKEYWFSHQENDLGLPNIFTRARSDLTDRIPYWLEAVLRHHLPQGQVLELGCSHGGFVAALRQAGFDASGLELSQWIVNFAKDTFHVPMYLGPIEQQQIEPASLDLIIMMDVLEHLPDPKSTMQCVANLLRPGGQIIIQTPSYPAGKSLNELSSINHPFLNMLIPGDHLHLYSPEALRQMMVSLGLNFVLTEPALFPYDQFVFISNQPVPVLSASTIISNLQNTAGRQFVLALMDLYRENKRYEELYSQADNDRIARLDQVHELDSKLSTLQADGLAREDELARQLKESDADRAARLETIHKQAQQLIDKTYEHNRLLTQVSSIQKTFQDIQTSPIYRVMPHSSKVKALETSFAEIREASTKHKLNRVIIDLTPIRPGGENGGMKLAAIELVKQFSREIAPTVEFILFTSSDTHDELAWLDAPNVRRICVNQVANAPQIAAAASSSSMPHSNGARQKRSFSGQIIHSVAQTLESLLPPEVFRNIYQRYRHQVQSPKEQNLVRSLGADLVFCPFSAVFYHTPEIPTVVIIADLQFLYYPEFFTVEQNYHADRNFRKVCQVASRLICLSDFTRKSVILKGQVEPELAVTSYPSLWNPLDEPTNERVLQALEKWNLKEGQYLFCPANFWRHKNHAMLLTAFKLFMQAYPESELKLVLAGAPGERMDALCQAAKRMGLEKRVVFTGYLNADEVSAVLQGSLALIFPSLFEGFGVPVLEAMQFGKPVLCSNTTCLPEVAGEAAVYFDPRRPDEIVRAIERITTEADLAKALSAKGKQQALKFSDVRLWAENYYKILEDAFQGDAILHNFLNGLLPDGWAGTYLEVSAASEKSPRMLEMRLNVPPWFPKPELSVHFQGRPLQKAYDISIHRGTTQTIQLGLTPESGLIEIFLKPVAIPKALGINEDNRQLTCLVEACRVIVNGRAFDLLHGDEQ
jgi:glycosyltransferase involved in cell wall biosynthesis/2-polyprenyl-3-methyl-5-hydroxy-6-metoxy-1,4-benzoquinol methylase